MPKHLTFLLDEHPVEYRDGQFHSPDERTASGLNDALDDGRLRSGRPIIVPPLFRLALALEREYGDAITDIDVPDPPPLPDGAIV